MKSYVALIDKWMSPDRASGLRLWWHFILLWGSHLLLFAAIGSALIAMIDTTAMRTVFGFGILLLTPALAIFFFARREVVKNTLTLPNKRRHDIEG